MRKWGVVTLVLAIGGVTLHADDAKPKAIKEIMAEAHKQQEGLLAKVRAASASKEEKETLLALYTDLSKNKPPKGDARSWKMKTDALVAAAKGVVAGEAGAERKLNQAANCMGCHSVHRASK